MHLVLTECKRLEGEVVVVLLLLSLRWSSRAESVRKLFDCEDTLGIVMRYLLQCHASQESKIIRLYGLGSAKLLKLTDFAMTVQSKGRFVVDGALDSKLCENDGQGIEMRPKTYAYSLKRRTTNENAHVRTDTLQVTKDNCIERQEEMNCGGGLQMAAKADRLIMI